MWGGQPVVVLRIRGRETASRGPGGAHAGSLRAPAYCRTLVGRPPECRSALHVAILCKQFVGPALCWPTALCPFPALLATVQSLPCVLAREVWVIVADRADWTLLLGVGVG